MGLLVTSSSGFLRSSGSRGDWQGQSPESEVACGRPLSGLRYFVTRCGGFSASGVWVYLTGGPVIAGLIYGSLVRSVEGGVGT